MVYQQKIKAKVSYQIIQQPIPQDLIPRTARRTLSNPTQCCLIPTSCLKATEKLIKDCSFRIKKLLSACFYETIPNIGYWSTQQNSFRNYLAQGSPNIFVLGLHKLLHYSWRAEHERLVQKKRM